MLHTFISYVTSTWADLADFAGTCAHLLPNLPSEVQLEGSATYVYETRKTAHVLLLISEVGI
jgi:hypothetical protein